MPEQQPDKSGTQQKNKIAGNAKKKVATSLFFGVFTFAAVQALGIITAARIKRFFSPANNDLPALTVADFITVFAVTTIFLLFVVYTLKFRRIKKTFLKILFSLVIFAGGAVFFGIWLGGAQPLLAALFLVVLWWLYPTVFTQNLCVFFAILGAGLSLGLIFPPEAVVILLVMFSIYDFISVYFTKHMVRLAKEMMSGGAIAAFFIPGNLSGFNERIETATAGGGRHMVLGGGDIVFPLMLAVSVVDQSGVLAASVVAAFALVGFSVSFYIFVAQKIRNPIPALPAIAFFSILGYLVSKVV